LFFPQKCADKDSDIFIGKRAVRVADDTDQNVREFRSQAEPRERRSGHEART